MSVLSLMKTSSQRIIVKANRIVRTKINRKKNVKFSKPLPKTNGAAMNLVDLSHG
jgi:hypothetical protein